MLTGLCGEQPCLRALRPAPWKTSCLLKQPNPPHPLTGHTASWFTALSGLVQHLRPDEFGPSSIRFWPELGRRLISSQACKSNLKAAIAEGKG